MCILGVSALQDITNANAPMSCLDGDENSSVHQCDESCDLKLQIQEALGAISKLPSDEMLQRIRNVKVQYSAINGDPSMAHSGRKPKSWVLNYPALACMLNGGYYADYASMLGTMGLPVMHHKTWEGLVGLVGSYVEQLAQWSCEIVRDDIIARGDQGKWMASYDGFYLTRGFHSNNSTGTMHDVASDKIAWFAHRTKRGSGANWVGTSSGTEGDMLKEILGDVKSKGFTVDQIVIDHDTSANAIVCSEFPDIHITYCGNHTAKSFHRDLSKVKGMQCNCKKEKIKCKRMTEAFIERAKHALKNLMSCADVLEDDDPLKAFSEGLLNFYNHYCLDAHDSKWCKYHSKENDDGSPYTVKIPLLCPVQGAAFKELLEGMAKRPQEYVTPNGKVTTNSIEGFHGLALKYRNKRTDLKHAHYCCKTNMAICHKNLGPLWKLIALCEMGVDIPAEAVGFMLREQDTWKKLREKRKKADYLHYRSKLKLKASERHVSEKEHMVTLNAVGYTTGEYMGSTNSGGDIDDDEDDDDDDGGEGSSLTTTQDEGE